MQLLIYASSATFGLGEACLLLNLEGSWSWRGFGALCVVGLAQSYAGVLLEMRGWLQQGGLQATTCMLLFFGGLSLEIDGLATGLLLHCGSIANALDVLSVVAKAVVMCAAARHFLGEL